MPRKGSEKVEEKQQTTINVNAEIRRAIIALIKNDDPIVSTIIDSISQAITTKLVDNADFATKIVNCFRENGLVEQIKQEIYESCHMEVSASC